jgi:hypothetical protein
MSSNTKWTPGTLAYIDALCKTHHQPTYSEMAAAILAVSPQRGEIRIDVARDLLYSLAERLRLIGADE